MGIRFLPREYHEVSTVCEQISTNQIQRLRYDVRETLRDGKERGFIGCADGTIRGTCIGDDCSVKVLHGLCPEARDLFEKGYLYRTHGMEFKETLFHTHPGTDEEEPIGVRKNLSYQDLEDSIAANACVGYESHGNLGISCTERVSVDRRPEVQARRWKGAQRIDMLAAAGSMELERIRIAMNLPKHKITPELMERFIKIRDVINKKIFDIVNEMNEESNVCKRDFGPLDLVK